MSRTTIRSITIEPLNIPLLEPFTIATGSVSEARNVLITITLEDGSVVYVRARLSRRVQANPRRPH